MIPQNDNLIRTRPIDHTQYVPNRRNPPLHQMIDMHHRPRRRPTIIRDVGEPASPAAAVGLRGRHAVALQGVQQGEAVLHAERDGRDAGRVGLDAVAGGVGRGGVADGCGVAAVEGGEADGAALDGGGVAGGAV